MFAEFTSYLISLIQSHGILAVIIGVAIETIIVPIPSPLILMSAGSLLIPQDAGWTFLLHAGWISLVAGITQTIGSFLVYGFAYWLGKPFIVKYERFHGVSWNDIERFQQKFSTHRKEEVTLFLLRALPIMPLSIISGVAGIMKMPWKKYSIATFLGVLPRNMILAALGFLFSEAYVTLAQHLDSAETIMTLLIAALLIGYVIGHKFGIFEKIRKKVL